MFSIPRVTKNLLIVNALMALATYIFSQRGTDLNAYLGLHFIMSPDFHFYQFFTYMFMHAHINVMPSHIIFNMFAVWMFGSILERVWGEKKFLFYYILCGLGAGITQEIVQWIELSFFPDVLISLSYTVNNVEQHVSVPMAQYILMSGGTVGASGCVFGILIGFGALFPNERLFIIPFPFPIKAKWLVIGYIAIEVFSALTGPGDGIAHTAHLGGALFGFLIIRYWNKHPDTSFDRSRGQQFFENLKRSFDQRQQGSRQHHNPHMHAEQGGSKEADMEYNARKRRNQEEIDAILDKIRKSGYDSLSKEEKQKLFDASKQ